MKFKVGDKILVTAGKEKGKQGEIVKVWPHQYKVTVKDINIYNKHVKPYGDRAGEKISYERALPTANIAIINDKGQADRVGYQVAKDGKKVRIFKKTGKVISSASSQAKKQVKPSKKTSKKTTNKTQK